MACSAQRLMNQCPTDLSNSRTGARADEPISMSTNVPPWAAVSSQRWKPPVVGQLHFSSLSSSRRSMIRVYSNRRPASFPAPGYIRPQPQTSRRESLPRPATTEGRWRGSRRAPDLIHRRIKVGLRTVVRHHANLPELRARECGVLANDVTSRRSWRCSMTIRARGRGDHGAALPDTSRVDEELHGGHRSPGRRSASCFATGRRSLDRRQWQVTLRTAAVQMACCSAIGSSAGCAS